MIMCTCIFYYCTLPSYIQYIVPKYIVVGTRVAERAISGLTTAEKHSQNRKKEKKKKRKRKEKGKQRETVSRYNSLETIYII